MVHPSPKVTREIWICGMSTRGWKQCRHRRTFPVTRSLVTNRVPFCTLKRRVFGKFDPLMETFLECETMCREPPSGHMFVESLAEIDWRKVAEVVRRTRHKKQCLCDPFFALSPKPIALFCRKRAKLSLFRPQPHLPSFIQIHPRFINENDVSDRYNNRRLEIGWPIITIRDFISETRRTVNSRLCSLPDIDILRMCMATLP